MKITHTNCPACGSEKIGLHIKCHDYSISKEDFDIFKCNDCEFVFTQNIPSQETIGPYYQSEDYISHSNTKEGLINRLYHTARNYMLGQKYKLVEKKLKSNGRRLLDIGTGTGFFIDYMQKKNWDVVGVEPDPDAAAFGKKEFGLRVDSPNMLFGGTYDKFNTITMWHVMEHLHDKSKYLNRIHELLEDNGTVIIAVPNYSSHDGDAHGKYWAGYDVPRHLWHFSPKTMEAIVSKHGFNLESKHIMPLDSFYVSLLSEKYKGNSMGLLRGAWTGGISYLKAKMNTNRCSSVIYVFRKK